MTGVQTCALPICYGGTVEQFKLHRERPDLTKTDALLAVMSAQTPQVLAERAELEKQLLGCTSIAAVPAQQKQAGNGADAPARSLSTALAEIMLEADDTAARQKAEVEVPSPAPEPEPESQASVLAAEAARNFLQGCGVVSAVLPLPEEEDMGATVLTATRVTSVGRVDGTAIATLSEAHAHTSRTVICVTYNSARFVGLSLGGQGMVGVANSYCTRGY